MHLHCERRFDWLSSRLARLMFPECMAWMGLMGSCGMTIFKFSAFESALCSITLRRCVDGLSYWGGSVFIDELGRT